MDVALHMLSSAFLFSLSLFALGVGCGILIGLAAAEADARQARIERLFSSIRERGADE